MIEEKGSETKYVIWLNDPPQYYGGGYVNTKPNENSRSIVNARRYDSVKAAKGSITQGKKYFQHSKIALELTNIDIRPVTVTVELA